MVVLCSVAVKSSYRRYAIIKFYADNNLSSFCLWTGVNHRRILLIVVVQLTIVGLTFKYRKDERHDHLSLRICQPRTPSALGPT
ncbi:hypothetical protein ACHAXM_004201 [Skeletonema potamos]|jgi:hypothetical protein